MKNLQSVIFVLMSISIFSCTNVSEEDLIDNTPPPEFVNFEEDIRIIFQNNCWDCHGTTPTNGASTSLVFYEEVVNGVENNNVIERISGQSGFNPMPLGSPTGLPSNLVELVIQWQEDGFLETP